MINYICDFCGTPFEEPKTQTFTEWLGEFSRTYTEERCPICYGLSFSPADSCPKCNDPKLKEDLLCRQCRYELKTRFSAFADELTAEEEEQLDEWTGGDTIANRRNWT